jgi:hypothetical protein
MYVYYVCIYMYKCIHSYIYMFIHIKFKDNGNMCMYVYQEIWGFIK